jgi:large subunit ribosomal protein L29
MDNISMSTQELIKELKEAEKVLFDLRFKKATRQPFKPHQIKATKKKVAVLKTILRSKFLD